MQQRLKPMALAICLAAPLLGNAAEFNVGSNTVINLGGLFAVGAKSAEVTDTARAVQRESRVDDNTSRVIISGNTDLGNGLKAIFRLESRFTADTRPSTPLVPGSTTNVGAGTGWADGDTWAGLAGDFGSVYFGKSTLYYADTMAIPNLGIKGAGESYRIWDGNGLSTFNMLSQVGTKGGVLTTLGITRSQNVVRWDTPTVKGFDGSLAYTKNASGDENHFGCAGCAADYESGGTWYGRLRYNEGPISASMSVFHTKVQGAVVTAPYLGPLDKTGYRAGVAYTFPTNLKVGLVYDNTNVHNGIPGATGDAKRGVFSIPVSYMWDKHAAYLTYTRAGSTSNLDSSGAKQLNLGYDYAFAKNTFIGVFFTQLKNDSNGSYSPFLSNSALGGSAPKTGEGFRQISLDINYWF
ncbi:porin [Duganella sp. LX20W]|uniref:Porin n=1 Tax=Rugamonas brunnea TaxID=2758569 RepID=A0A7W2ES60_9BURK|nr:porin [Rugamonas brunnea]MBA5637630.1 porin [Rugamonas brunnea]